jgi:hypothetical protein
MGPERLGTVLEKLATTAKTTLVVEKQPDGKMRVTSGSWEGEKVFLRDQVLEVRCVDGRLHVARKARNHDEWDVRVEPYYPNGRPTYRAHQRRVTRHGDTSHPVV